MAFDGALQRTCAVSTVEPFGEQKILRPCGATDREISGPGHQYAALNNLEFDVQDPAQRFLGERMKNHDLVESVDEFRREFAARRLDADLLDSSVEFRG